MHVPYYIITLILSTYYIKGMGEMNSVMKHLLCKCLSCLDAFANLYTGTISVLLVCLAIVIPYICGQVLWP